MNRKEARRIEAIKRGKRKKAIIIAGCALAAIAVVGVLIFAIIEESNARVFVSGSNQIILFEDGRFSAILPHNVTKSGTFTETTEGNLTTVLFTHGGNTVSTNITGNVLRIPVEWEDGHGHNPLYTLREGF